MLATRIVDRPERLLDLAGERGEALEVGGVGDEGARARADRGGRLLDPLARAAGDRDPAALAGERGGDRPADAAAGAHHQRRASLESEIHLGPDPRSIPLSLKCRMRAPVAQWSTLL